MTCWKCKWMSEEDGVSWGLSPLSGLICQIVNSVGQWSFTFVRKTSGKGHGISETSSLWQPRLSEWDHFLPSLLYCFPLFSTSYKRLLDAWWSLGAVLGGGCRGCASPWDDLRLSNTTDIRPKKIFVVYWFSSKTSHEVEEFMLNAVKIVVRLVVL